MRNDFVKKFLLGLTTFGFATFGLVGCESARNLNTSFAPDNAHTPTLGASYLERAKAATSDIDDQIPDFASLSPETAIDYQNVQYQPITLEECVRKALAESEVFRELGGAIVSQTSAVQTALDPALQFTDPLAGEEAALSVFDSVFNSSLFYENNDRPFNNRFSGEDGLLKQDLLSSRAEFNKLAATGTQFTSRASAIYDANNQTGNRFGSSWEAFVDAGFRHPLMQGGGSMFNRIAGPSRIPGNYNGVLIARTNTEMTLTDFESSVREFVSNVENAYWDLYYAYRELEAQTNARDAAASVVEKTQVLRDEEKIGQLELASAKEQLLRFESAIIESMEGRLVDGTQANSGITGGSFRRTVGVRTAERRLRYLIGASITDGMLLKPIEQPTRAALAFDWNHSVDTALSERPESRRQKWMIKQKQLELTASRNFLLPRVDLVGNYRVRGLGKQLVGTGDTLIDDINSAATSETANSNAVSDLFSGNFQEAQFGAEFTLPVGFRQANAAVRNAELSVQREKAILKEQQRKIVLDLSNAISECRRAFNAMNVAEQRYGAAVEYRTQAEDRVERGRSQYDVLLEAQRRILESQLQFINAEVEYAVAIKNVHFEKASYLTYHGIALSESESDPKATDDFRSRRSRMVKPMSYAIQGPVIGMSLDAIDPAVNCSTCGNTGSACGCSKATSQCSTCEQQPCGCGASHGAAISASPVFVSTPPSPGGEAVADETEKTDLPADGLGKKHVYEPKFLPPPTPKSGR